MLFIQCLCQNKDKHGQSGLLEKDNLPLICSLRKFAMSFILLEIEIYEVPLHKETLYMYLLNGFYLHGAGNLVGANVTQGHIGVCD